MSTVPYDVVLLYPKKRLTYATAMVPLGLLSIGSVLEKAGFRVRLVDLNVYKGILEEEIQVWQPKMLGFGGTTPTRKVVFELARQMKNLLPDLIVVYGGPHASFTANETLQGIAEIDYTISGEGEYALLDLCKKHLWGEEIPLSEISGLGYRSGSRIIQNSVRRIDELENLPLPAYHLLDQVYPLKLDLLGVQAAFLMTSRGCPVQCVFCSASALYKGGVRYRPIRQIQEEIDLLTKSQKIEGLKLFDSTFTSDSQHVRDFCSMIKPYNLLWECEVRADSVSLELLTMMREAGCRFIDLGLESSNPKYLRALNKSISLDQVIQVIDWCNELNIQVKLFLIFGHPDQTFMECIHEFRFMKKYRSKVAFFDVSFGMRIYPGTQLEVMARKRGIIPAGFSWINFRPTWRRLLLGDPSDAFTWEHSKLNLYHLALLAAILHLRGYIMTRGMYKRIFIQYFKHIKDKINIFR